MSHGEYGGSRSDKRKKNTDLKTGFDESAETMNDGSTSAQVTEKVAKESVARYTSEARSAVQQAFERGRAKAIEHTDQAAEKQQDVLDREAKPFAQEQEEAGKSGRDDAQLADRAQSDAAVGGTKEALAEASRAQNEEADFREELAQDQNRDNEQAERTAEEKKREANETDATLRSE